MLNNKPEIRCFDDAENNIDIYKLKLYKIMHFQEK